jgi:hypothetical protein
MRSKKAGRFRRKKYLGTADVRTSVRSDVFARNREWKYKIN